MNAAGAGGHREQVDRGGREPGLGEHALQVARQSFDVARRGIAAVLDDDLVVTKQRHGAARRARVDGENHIMSAVRIPTILDVCRAGPVTGRPFRPLRRGRPCPAPPIPRRPLPTPGASVTPAMRQYLDAKRQYPLALVLFRMGDFYELFYEDALVAARALDLTLTSRSKDATGAAVPMCGVPHHAADGYVARLVKKGHRVAICEQVEDPKQGQGRRPREVVRVISPGTLADAGYLDAREPAFLLAVTGLDEPAGPQARTWRRPARPLDRRVPGGRVPRRARPAGADDDVAVLAPREIVVRRRA